MILVEQKQPAKLKQTIGLWSAVAINVGAIIGAGIFVVIGVAANHAGSSLILSMIIAGIIAFFTAFSFFKLTAWKPVEGSVYEYGRRLISPFWGFTAGWMWSLANTFTGATVALGFGYYLSATIPSLPANLVAAVLCLGFTALNFIGVKESAHVNNILVALKIAILGFFIAYGALFFNIQNFAPFMPVSSGVLYGAFFIFFAYGGFARIAVAAEEVKDARRNIPRAMLYSLAISMAIYVLVGIVAVGLVNPVVLAGSNSPLTAAIGATDNMLAFEVISLGGLVATASVLLTAILGVSRMLFSMARQKDLPFFLSRLHKRFCTPYYAILATGLIMTTLVLFVDLNSVLVLSTFSLLFNYSIVNVSAFNLKMQESRLKRYIPVLGVVSCATLLLFTLFAEPSAWAVGLAFVIVGAVFYKAKKHFNAHKAYNYDKDFKVK